MPIKKIVRAVAGKPNIDEIPSGYNIIDFKKIPEGFVVVIRPLP